VLLLVSLTGERATYLALELDRRWTEMADNKVRSSVRMKSESLRVMTYLLAAFRALTKFTRFRDLSSATAECRSFNLLRDLPYVIHFKGAPSFGEGQV
jgi:hypothetical protein